MSIIIERLTTEELVGFLGCVVGLMIGIILTRVYYRRKIKYLKKEWKKK